MKLLRKIKPSKAVGKPGFSAPAIQGAMVKLETVPTRVAGGKPTDLEPKDHLVLYVTNGYSFMRIDLGVKDSMDEPGPVPVQALRHMEKGVNLELGLDFARVGLTRYERILADTLHGDVSGEKFPDFEEVIGKHWKEPTGSNELTVNLNPKLLMAAAEAIGETDEVEITLDLRKFKELEEKVMSEKERRQHKGKRRRFYSGPLKLSNRGKVPRNQNPAYGFLMPIHPGTRVRDEER